MSSPSSSADSVFDAVIEQFLTEHERGASPDQRAYIARYPEVSEKLREFFRTWDGVNAHIQAAKEEIADVVPKNKGQNGNGHHHYPSGLGSIGGFELLEKIGHGSQGDVYRAKQPGTNRLVALKVMRDAPFCPKVRQRFEIEVHSAARLRHPNVVSAYQCGRDDGYLYFAMEFVEGEHLDKYARRTRPSIKQTVELFLQACDAVAYAHQHGILHRDLKPSNILVDHNGQVRVLDFGLAKILDDDSKDKQFTISGEFTGTCSYAAPEQFKGNSRDVDTRTDIYTLGLILYELLTFELPYDARAFWRIGGVYDAILRTSIPSPAAFRSEIPDDLATIVLMALKKQPADRYQSAAALAQDLRRFLGGEPIEAKRDSRWYVLRATLRYYRWQLAAVTAVILILTAFAATVTVLYARARTAQATAEAKGGMGRLGQAYLLTKLDRLNRLENVTASIAEQHAGLPAISRVSRPSVTLPENLVRVLGTGPRNLFTSGESNAEASPQAREWLSANADAMLQLASILNHSSIDFAFSTVDSDFIADAARKDTYFAERVAGLFVAKALMAFDSRDIHDSGASLDLAREVALAIGDGPFLYHKTASITCRRELYGTALHLLQMTVRQDRRADPIVDWIERDPPLPDLEPAMLSERTKVLQLAEAALVESKPGALGHIDLDLLNKATKGYYAKLGLLTPENRRLAEQLDPEQIIRFLDGIAANPGEIMIDEQSPAGAILGPILPRVRGVVRASTAFESMREACRIAGKLWRYREAHGHWPGTLSELEGVPIDPIAHADFAYAKEPTGILLYSLNVDGVPDSGRWGQFMQSGTDILLFTTAQTVRPIPLKDVHCHVDQ